MSFFKDVSFKAAGNDLVGYLLADRQYNGFLWAAACLPPLLIVATFYFDAIKKSTPPEPGVFYFESWPATRSLEDVKRDAVIRHAEKRRILEERRQAYKALGRASGMDVERIEREAAAKKKAADRKAEAKVRADAPVASGAAK